MVSAGHALGRDTLKKHLGAFSLSYRPHETFPRIVSPRHTLVLSWPVIEGLLIINARGKGMG